MPYTTASPMSGSSAWKGAAKVQRKAAVKARSLALTVRVFFGVFVLLCGSVFYVIHEPQALRMSAVWLIAQYKQVSTLGSDNVRFRLASGKRLTLPATRAQRHPSVASGLAATQRTLAWSALCGVLGALVLTGSTLYLLRRLGGDIAQKGKFIRGARIVTARNLSKAVRRLGPSDLTIGKVPLRLGAETQHVFISGATGAGKSSAIKGLLDTIRARGQRFIIYDKSGEYVSRYYRAGHDIILNPFDARMPQWDVWCEAQNPYDFEHLAASFMPDDQAARDPHWAQSARVVLAELWEQVAAVGEAKTSAMMQLLLDKHALYQLLERTAAAAEIDPDIPEHSGSVLAVLLPKIKSMRYLRDTNEEGGFSLREWVRDDRTDRCVFVTCNERQKQSVQPLITAWLDIVVSEMLSLGEQRERRLFCVVDELASLDRINSIVDGVNEGRKFGLCCVLSVTSIEMLISLYGREKARTMIGMCATKVCFRCDEPDSAEWLARLFGEEDVMDEAQAITVSAKSDATNIQDSRTSRLLVMPTEFANLPDEQAMVKLGGGLPIAQVEVPYVERRAVAEAFVVGQPVAAIQREVRLADEPEKIGTLDLPFESADTTQPPASQPASPPVEEMPFKPLLR